MTQAQPTSMNHSTSLNWSTDGAFLLELTGKMVSSTEVDTLGGFESVVACNHFCFTWRELGEE